MEVATSIKVRVYGHNLHLLTTIDRELVQPGVTIYGEIVGGTLSVGQAKILVGLEPNRPLHLACRIRRERLTVRQVEALMRQIRSDPCDLATVAFDADPRHPDHVRFEGRLSEQLGGPVTVEYARKGSGRLILAFRQSGRPGWPPRTARLSRQGG